jgi:threonine dehydrogenase-like Zn-dependent dehydrogenase
MRGIAAFPNSTRPGLVEVAEPCAPTAGQVLCRTLELGICGTDREILESRRPHVPPGEPFLILGHECLARVEALGPLSGDDAILLSDRLAPSRSAQPLREGELIVPVVRRALPGHARRVDMLALGQFSERGIFDEHGFSTPLWLDQPRYLLRVPPELQSVAVLTEPLAVAAKAINEALLVQQSRLEQDIWRNPPPRVLVTGLGPIAFAALLMTRIRDWPSWVYGRDQPQQPRPALARRLGAEYATQSSFDAQPAEVEADGFDLILECTGSDEVALHVAPWLRSCGVMAWLGSQRDPQPRPANFGKLVRDGLIRNNVFLGCVNAAPRDFQEALVRLAQWLRRDAAALDSLITARVPQQEALPHFESRQANSIKSVVVFS